MKMFISKLKKRIHKLLDLFNSEVYLIYKCLGCLVNQRDLVLHIYIKRVIKLLYYQYLISRLSEVYHPILIPELHYIKAVRLCTDRINLINSDIEGVSASINDIGCQIGFFSLSFAKAGCNVNGFDMDRRNIQICNIGKELLDLSSNVCFKKFKLTVESCKELPVVDYTLCLAVFHHIIYEQGLDAANSIISTLRKKTRKKLYFEIGQSNEKIKPWCDHLPNMGKYPYKWIVDFLKKAGFNKNRCLGMVPTHLSEVKRYLFVSE